MKSELKSIHFADKLFFSDLDGTILDHETYSSDKSMEGINLLSKNDIPLILVSSKTFQEMKEISADFSLHYPFIFENGGGIGFCSKNEYEFILLGLSSDELYSYKDMMQDYFKSKIKMFRDMSIPEIVDLTHLSYASAKKAAAREASQPFVFVDNKEVNNSEIECFNKAFYKNDISLTKGGRFYHLISAKTSKGKAIKYLIDNIGSSKNIITGSAGDSYNDFAMFEATHFPFLVKKATLCEGTSFEKDIMYTTSQGPEGFSEAVKIFLKRVNDNEIGT